MLVKLVCQNYSKKQKGQDNKQKGQCNIKEHFQTYWLGSTHLKCPSWKLVMRTGWPCWMIWNVGQKWMVEEKSFLAFIQFFPLDASMAFPWGFSKVLQSPKDPLRKEQVAGKVKIYHASLYAPKIKWIQTIKWKTVRAAWIFSNMVSWMNQKFYTGCLHSHRWLPVPHLRQDHLLCIIQIFMANHLTRSDFGWYTIIK